MQIEARNAAAGALADVTIERDEKCGTAVTLHHARRHDADDARMPPVTDKDEARVSLEIALLLELCTATATAVADPQAIACLSALTGSGKAATRARELLALAPGHSTSGTSDRARLRLRVERAERFRPAAGAGLTTTPRG